MRKLIILLFLLVTQFGCAGKPFFDTTLVNSSLTPEKVAAKPDGSLGEFALWGGTILDTRNLKDSTQIEILAYPLNRSQRPLLKEQPLGRFLILHKGFLEPTLYAQGKQLTVLGKVRDNLKGNVGDSGYTYPVVEAEKMQLWKPGSETSTRFHFGIGIGL